MPGYAGRLCKIYVEVEVAAILLAFVATVFGNPAFCEEKSPDPLKTVHQYISAFNKGDINAMAPHIWKGANAVRDWYKDVLTEGEHVSATGYNVKIGAPLHNNVTKDSA